ncbi:MAG: hypothetical protein DI603_05130 [Roseateles depolymerans]|uniref:SGNH hydrolase-type esterase domain-containing protein n=1 Tax=Roseateles depolymerans TaxID=76731 RepID=A0A2W5DQY1_9BURK|nr:MAG: hypothetical protein DI603_05130 [Roseateles depolymerans]
MQFGRRWRVGLWGALALLLVLGSVEAGLRQLGLVDFPVYEANAEIGYIPAVGQQGRYLNRNDWQVNELHMSAPPFRPSPQGNLLLIGDSIVWGGNPYAAHERLGAQLQALTPTKVWPIAAGSWGLQNELTYLNQYPEVVQQVDQIVFVSNSGDFDRPSSWTCEMTHPRERPRVAMLYLLQKYVFKTPCPAEPPPGLAVTPRDPLQMLAEFAREHPGKPLKFVLYPDREECELPALRQTRLERFKPLLLASGATEVHSLGEFAGWKNCASIYKDGIHPLPEGFGLLATFIRKSLGG